MTIEEYLNKLSLRDCFSGDKRDMHMEKFMIYRRDAKKGEATYSPKMPTLMWLASGKPAFWAEVTAKDYVAWVVMLCGLLLSIWTIVYMKLRGKGNPICVLGRRSPSGSSSLPSCSFKYLAKSDACIVTLATSMMLIAVILEDFNNLALQSPSQSLLAPLLPLLMVGSDMKSEPGNLPLYFSFFSCSSPS